MLEAKAFYIKDIGTSVKAIAMRADGRPDEIQVLADSGFGDARNQLSYVWLGRADGHDITHDSYNHSSRTMHRAHKALLENWDCVARGGTLDVEHMDHLDG